MRGGIISEIVNNQEGKTKSQTRKRCIRFSFICETAPKIPLEMKTAGFCAIQNPAEQIFKNIRSLLDDSHFQTTFNHLPLCEPLP
ncbi:MAG: hypothetical protein D8H97_36480 [Neisseria sp.]|nr:MAG: hypothetical protein D8H97_36480 [Neisseria sp.]